MWPCDGLASSPMWPPAFTQWQPGFAPATLHAGGSGYKRWQKDLFLTGLSFKYEVNQDIQYG